MGLHLVLLAKLKLITITHHHVCLGTPIIVSLLGPFLLKFFFTTFRPLQQAFINTIYSSRLFIFQMGQIINSNSEPPGFSNGPGTGTSTRWQRALRLVNERLTLARHSQVTESDEESLRALSVLAL
ncbi:hypothetical protein ACH5RR_038674 [Cinchona calisaya]|uniref:Uncharacterized protein n=1 Tax=Cinchona calisaya TaxID=153742 RepID=A0ABD2XVZ4_9GENT